MASEESAEGLDRCGDCGCDLVEGTDAMGYEMRQCPGCSRWVRPGDQQFREPLTEGNYAQV